MFSPRNLQSTPPGDKPFLHFQEQVSEGVYDLGLSSVRDPLSFRSVQVHVPVQPQGGFVAVYEPQKRLEAYMGGILAVAEAEGRGVADEDLRRRPAGELAGQNPGRERQGPSAHLALGVLVRASGVQAGPRESRDYDTVRVHDPAVERRAPLRTLGAVGRGVVVAEHVVEGHTEERDYVLEVVERQVAAGDHGLHTLRVGGELRAVEHGLHAVADAQYLHVRPHRAYLLLRRANPQSGSLQRDYPSRDAGSRITHPGEEALSWRVPRRRS